MANEITARCSMRYDEGSVGVEFGDGASFSVDVSGSKYHLGIQSLSTSPAALNKGNVGTPGMMIIVNRSSTAGQIVRLKTATGGVDFCKIYPGKWAMFMWDESRTAPYVTADAGTPQIEYLLVEA